MNRVATSAAVFFLMAGCSPKAPLVNSPKVRVVFETIQDPLQELCRDDTLGQIGYINVPLVRFARSTIELNGVASSERELLDWAQKRYPKMAEQTLWVQVSPDNRPIAEHALLPLVQRFPQLHLRQVDPGFTCLKQ